MSDSNLANLYYKQEGTFADSAIPQHGTGTFTLTGQPANAETVTIQGTVYTYKTTLTPADGEVLIGKDSRESLINLAAAINAEPGNGARYQINSGLANANAFAEISDLVAGQNPSLVLTTKAYTSVTTTKTVVNGSWSGATTTGEVAPGAQTYIQLRFTKESLTGQKDTVESEEIRSDRSLGELVQVGLGAGGQIDAELIAADLDPFILNSLMAVSFTTGTDVLTCTGDATAQTITTSTTFSAALQAAKFVNVSAFGAVAGNQGVKRIVKCTTTVMTLEPGSLTANQTSTANVNLGYRYARNGVNLNSYLILKQLIVAGTFMVYRGMCLDSFTLTAAAKQKVMASLGFLGYSGEKRFATFATTVTPPSVNPIITSSNNVGFVNIDDIGIVSPVTNLTFGIKNNLRERFSLGRQGTLAPGKGTSNISGKMDVYFDSVQSFQYFMAHKRKSLHFYFKDAGNKVLSFYLPKIRFLEGNPNIGGLNQDIIVPLSWRGLKDPDDSTGYQCQVDLVP